MLYSIKFDKILNIFAKFFFIILLLILFIASIKVIYKNIKHFGETKTGIILDINLSRGSRSTHSRGTYLYTILTDIKADTIYGGNKNRYDIGDKVKVNYRGTGGNIIFEVNGIKKGWKHDAWDFFSPILLLFSSFFLYSGISSFLKRKRFIA